MLSTLHVLKTKHEEKAGSWHQLVNQSRPEWPLLSSFFAVAFLITFCEMQVVLLAGKMLDAAVGSRATEFLETMRLLIVLQLFIITACNVLYYLNSSTGLTVYIRTQNQLYAAIVTREQAFFDCRESGDLVSRLTNDAEEIKWAAGVILEGFADLVMLGTAIVEMMTIVRSYEMILLTPPLVEQLDGIPKLVCLYTSHGVDARRGIYYRQVFSI